MSSSRFQRRRGRPVKRIVALVLAVLLVLWAGGLVWFSSILPNPGEEAKTDTDAIVVLTGGSDRLAEGLRLLAIGRAKKLFVSGVYHGVDVAELLRVARRSPGDVECCIVLGYAAGNTAGNARETAEWMMSEGYRSLRLVTASYHMPRSLVEFHAAMPGSSIAVHPVFPEQFKQTRWWLWPGSAALIASEYNKYLMAVVRFTLFGSR